MFRPHIQRLEVLIVLALLSAGLFFWAAKSTLVVKARGHDLKIVAAEKMAQAMSTLKEVRLGSEGIVMEDNPNDPNGTMLIGSEYTPITTDRGNLDAKLTTLNPNFAAIVVDMLVAADVENGDTIAVAFTGSMPGANIGVLAACSAMEIHPVIITSLGASEWGATDPYFTWVDMETELFRQDVFKKVSIAASMGGGGDRGKDLSPNGRELLKEAINRNYHILQSIQEKDLESSISKRIDLFGKVLPLSDYKVYLNVGGGAASVGPRINARLVPPGLSSAASLKGDLADCVLKRFVDVNVPVIHIHNIEELAEKYDLPFSPIPMPETGIGQIFAQLIFNRTISLIALILTLGSLTAVGLRSHRQVKEVMEYDPEASL
jgi:poly-gamma-glutamate system protein